MSWKNDVVIVMPAYNEGKQIDKTIKTLHDQGYSRILVINDGSKDKTEEAAKKAGAKVYTHIINRGLGGALATGISAALNEDCKAIVTFDSDGQHDAKDMEKVVKPILKGECDAVIGSRLINPKGMPWYRRLGNKILNLVTYVLFGIYTTDSQSGFRAFSKEAAAKIKIRTDRMEVSSEIIKEIGRNKLRFKEVPIKAIYTEYSLARGQSNINGFNILLKLFWKRFFK